MMASCFLSVGVVQAEPISPQVIKKLKKAMVFIRNGDLSGSGFLIQRQGKEGLIVTNQQVVKGIKKGHAVVLYFNSGQADQRSMRGTLEVVLSNPDLALIKITAKNLPEPIALKSNSSSHETDRVFALGFPFGKQLSTNRKTPLISISEGNITSLRTDINDQTQFVQIDASINPGHSGGPVVDEKGNLVGVIATKLQNTRVGFIIPKRHLTQLLQGQVYDIKLTVKQKWLDSEDWVYQLSARAKRYFKKNKPSEIGLNIITTDRKSALSSIFPDGSWGLIKGKNFNLKLNRGSFVKKGSLKLASTLSDKKLLVQPYLKFKDKTMYQAPLWLELEKPELEQKNKLKFSFEGPNLSEKQLSGKKQHKNKPYKKNNVLKERKSTQYEPDSVLQSKEIQLPGVIYSLALARGGDYLVFSFKDRKDIVLLDLQQHKLIPLDLKLDESVLVAGDQDHIYLAGVDSGQLIKWSIADKKIVKKAYSPGGSIVYTMSAGWNSKNGSLFLITQEGFYILDSQTLKPKSLKWLSARHGEERKLRVKRNSIYKSRSAANGRFFTFWNATRNSNRINSLRLRGERITHFQFGVSSGGFVVPDREGKRVYTGIMGTYNNKLDRLADTKKNKRLIPGIKGKHIIEVNYQGKERSPVISLFNVKNPEKIMSIRIPGLTKSSRKKYKYIKRLSDQRFWLDENNHQLIVIPYSNNRIEIYNIKLN